MNALNATTKVTASANPVMSDDAGFGMALDELIAADEEARRVHSDACAGADDVALGRKANRKELKALQLAEEVQSAALEALLGYTPNSLTELVKLNNYVLAREGGYGALELFVAKGLAAAAERMTKVVQPTLEPLAAVVAKYDTWNEALAAYLATRAAVAQVNALDDAALAAMEAEAPVPEVLKCSDGGYHSSASIIKMDSRLSFDRKAEMLAALEEWSPRREAAHAKHGCEETNSALEEAQEAADKAETALLLTAAPDVFALVWKLRALINGYCVSETSDKDADDPTTISRMLSPTDRREPTDRWIAELYRDVLRMAGEPTSLLEVTAFDAKGWIVEFEKAPNHEVSEYGVAWLESDGARPGDFASWRALEPWQKAMVRAKAKTRDRELREAQALGGCGFYGPSFIEAVHKYGGTLHVAPDGRLWFGEFLDERRDSFMLAPIRRWLQFSSAQYQRDEIIKLLSGEELPVDQGLHVTVLP